MDGDAEGHVTGVGHDRSTEAGSVQHQHAVGLVPRRDQRQRAIAGAFLVDRGLEDQVPAQADPGFLQRLHDEKHLAAAGLVVLGAAGIQAIAFDLAAPGVPAPELNRLGRGRVDVRVEDQRPPAAGSMPAARHVRATLVGPVGRAPVRVARQRFGIAFDHLDVQPKLPHPPRHPLLCGEFLAAGTGNADELLQAGHMLVHAPVESLPGRGPRGAEVKHGRLRGLPPSRRPCAQTTDRPRGRTRHSRPCWS